MIGPCSHARQGLAGTACKTLPSALIFSFSLLDSADLYFSLIGLAMFEFRYFSARIFKSMTSLFGSREVKLFAGG